MLFFDETPSSAMYGDLRKFGGISNVDAARILLSSRIGSGGLSPRDRVSSPTFLSRNVVHVRPKDVNPQVFADFDSSSQTICGRILAHNGHNRVLVADHYSSDAALLMGEALANNGCPSDVYMNEVKRLVLARLRQESDRATLLVMLFCTTGCLADPHAATMLVEEFARHKLAEDVATLSSDVDAVTRGVQGGGDGPKPIGLLRVIDGAAQPPIAPLNPNGSLVGTLASGPGAVTNVDTDVSRQHLRIWCDGSRWLCQGMHSTNGTTIISGSDGGVVSVEPPRSRRSAKIDYPPAELHEGDILCLGATTRFLVMRLHAAE